MNHASWSLRRHSTRCVEILLDNNYVHGSGKWLVLWTRSLRLDDPTFDVECLPKLDRNFYYRCLLAVSRSNIQKGTLGESLTASMDAFDGLRPEGCPKTDVRPWGQVVADLSIQMATMACNSVWSNLSKIVVKYLRLKYPSLKKIFERIVKAVV